MPQALRLVVVVVEVGSSGRYLVAVAEGGRSQDLADSDSGFHIEDHSFRPGLVDLVDLIDLAAQQVESGRGPTFCDS